MKKQIIALAVAGIVSAPAMADLTLYGSVAVDYISSGTGSADNSQIQRDDVIVGLKGSSETDAGLMVGGEIKTEGDFAAPTLAYLNVGNGMATLWAGKFGNPADAADGADFSDTGNATHFAGEIDNAVAVTIAANGLTAALGAYQAAPTKTSYSVVSVAGAAPSVKTTAATDTDGTVAQLGYSAGGVSINLGYATSGATETSGVKVAYAGESFSAAVYTQTSEDVTFASGNYAGTHNEVTTTGVTGSYTMGATTLSAIVANDDVDGIGAVAGANGDNDVFALKVSHSLGGGLTAYAEYGSVDGDITNDYEAYTVGMSFSF